MLDGARLERVRGYEGGRGKLDECLACEQVTLTVDQLVPPVPADTMAVTTTITAIPKATVQRAHATATRLRIPPTPNYRVSTSCVMDQQLDPDASEDARRYWGAGWVMVYEFVDGDDRPVWFVVAAAHVKTLRGGTRQGGGGTLLGRAAAVAAADCGLAWLVRVPLVRLPPPRCTNMVTRNMPTTRASTERSGVPARSGV